MYVSKACQNVILLSFQPVYCPFSDIFGVLKQSMREIVRQESEKRGKSMQELSKGYMYKKKLKKSEM